jgi:hypothetical protein
MFLQSLFIKEERIAEIDGYHRQVDSLVTEFKLSHLINTNQWRSTMEEALAIDQQMLNNKLHNLETDPEALFKLLDNHSSDEARMVCLQRRLDSRSDGERERQFFRHVIQLLNARN